MGTQVTVEQLVKHETVNSDGTWNDTRSINRNLPSVLKLPVKITAEIPLKRFCVNDLLSLGKNDIVRTDLLSTEDIPFMAGRLHLAWSEFDVIDHRLVSRLTRLVQDNEPLLS
jgi:flagellar motor switch/type III secretory pathway protein FliN